NWAKKSSSQSSYLRRAARPGSPARQFPRAEHQPALGGITGTNNMFPGTPDTPLPKHSTTTVKWGIEQADIDTLLAPLVLAYGKKGSARPDRARTNKATAQSGYNFRQV